MKRCNLGLILPLLLLMNAAAVAQQGTPTQGFVYNLKLGDTTSNSMDFSMAFTIKATAQNGTRTASLVVKSPKMPPLDGKKLDATISPAGAITLGSTGDVNKHYSVFQSKSAAEAATGPMLQMLINPINGFASGCSLAPSQKSGTSWHAYSTESQVDVLYTITGRQQVAGRDTLVVTMKGASDSGPSVTGQGNYDPAAHLVVNLHSVMRLSPQAAQGQEVDVAMANP